MKDPYWDEEHHVLKNKLNIKEMDQLERSERDITTAKIAKIDGLLSDHPKVDFDYMKRMHQFLLGEIYPFAGTCRSIPVEKPEAVLGGDTVRYAYPKEISKEVKTCLREMNQIKWHKLPEEEAAKLFSGYTARIWKAHPFREGNTRTTMLFAGHYALEHGFSFERKLMEENSQYVRNALVKACDGMYADPAYLERIMKDAIQKGDATYFARQLKDTGFRPTETLIHDMREINRMYGKNVFVKEIHQLYKSRGELPKEERSVIEKVGRDFQAEERKELVQAKAQEIEMEI